MISVALILVLVLYLLLQRIFRNYQKQVLDLVDTMEAISQGDSDRRINVDTKEQELLLVAETTNTMLDNMDKSIRDIYQLQLSQKDANGVYSHVCSYAGSRRISRYYLRI